jgi:pyruvate formate lyase activating enzyme
MRFGGWHKCSLIDFPGKISVIVFTEGCSFRCPFCHNPGLVIPQFFTQNPIFEEDVLSFLEKRKGKLDGIVISGGEPTIQPDLENFLTKVRSLFPSFSIKLDTNGSRPEILKSLIQNNLVDYVAMDIKASFPLYEKIAGVTFDASTITKSISLLMNSSIDYEFRTTLLKEFHPKEEVETIALSIQGAKKYILQKFKSDITLDQNLATASSYSDTEMELLCDSVRPFVKLAEWR